MLEIFLNNHDAMQELKDLQLDNGDGNTLLRIGRALGATLQSAAQGGSSIIKAVGGAIHDTLNSVGDLDEKVVGSLGEAASKVIQSTRHAVKDSTTGISNMFHGILGGIGGTIQWCFILVILLVLLYINHSTVLKLCRRKTSRPSNELPPSTSTSSIDQNPAQNMVNNPWSTLERPPPTLPLVLASFSLHDLSISQEISGMVIPITILSQNDHISCSALVDTGSPVTLLSETLQCQLNFQAMPLKSHYHLVGAIGNALTTLGTVQVDITWDSKMWPTPAIVVSSLAHPLILGLNFLKLTKSKIDFNTNNVEIGSTIHPADVHSITNSIPTITIPTSNIY